MCFFRILVLGNSSLSWKGKREKMHRKFEENLTRGLSQFFISLNFLMLQSYKLRTPLHDTIPHFHMRKRIFRYKPPSEHVNFATVQEEIITVLQNSPEISAFQTCPTTSA
jgi:hypothetical protein